MRVVLCTCPPDRSESLATLIVEQRLAACVNIVPSVKSVYRWQDEIERETEDLLIIKTAADRLEALTETIKKSHPYTVPEVVALELKPGEGNDAYLRWLAAQTRPV